MTTKDFIAKLNDPDLVKKMETVTSPEEAFAIAKENGVTDSFEEFMNEMSALKEATGELSDDDLEAVAGGASTTEIVSAVSTTVQATATAASAAV